MKDVITSQKNIANDTHLKNIFVNESYLELGIIDVDVVKRLLNYELINIDQVTYFQVQNRGLGHSNLHDSDLKKYLPFHFFRKLALHNANLQLCISYGLLQYRNSDHREAFMPIILIPIQLFLENGDILVQMVSKPFINPQMYSVIVGQKITAIQSVDFKDIYALDNTLSYIDKLNDVSVRLDNYLTYVEVKEKDIILSYKTNTNAKIGFFSLGDKTSHQVDTSISYDHVYSANDRNIYTNIVFNKQQRETINRLVDGESLSITGYNGTGKSTILKSFIINNLANNKKTLYVSNLQDSINSMKTFLNDLMLSNYVVDLTESFKKMTSNSIIELYYDPTEDIKPLLVKLEEYYSYLDNYEKDINDSLYDFRFIDMVKHNYCIDNDLAQKIDDRWVEINDFSNIYRHEYENINDILLGIEESFQKIKSFQNSIWKEIPIINNITHVNQVINVVFQLNTGLKKLREYEITLGDFGVKSILSFSEMKKCIAPMDKMNQTLIPDSWKINVEMFNEAKRRFNELKDEITKYKDTLVETGKKYKNLKEIDIEEEIKALYGSYYHKKNLDDIENLLINKVDIKRTMANAYICINDFNNATSDLVKLTSWNFIEKDEYVKEILVLADLFKNSFVSGKMMNFILNNKVSSYVNDLNSLDKSIVELQNEITALEKQNPKLKNLDFSKGNVEYVNETYRSYDTRIKKLKRLSRDYKEICGFSQDKHQVNIDSINKLRDYYESLKQKKYRKIIADFILTVDENRYVEMLQLTQTFILSYNKVKGICDSFEKYGITFNQTSIKTYVDKFTDYVNYLNNLFKSNEKMMDVVINNELDYVKPEEYFLIEKDIKEINRQIAALQTNEDYHMLYGTLFKANETDIVDIMESIQMFEEYEDVFVASDKVYNSFKKYDELKTVVNKVVELINEIGENLRLYSLIFKDSVSRYYFSNIENNVAYLTKLLDSQEELSIYLSITDGIRVLNEYKLHSIIKFIEENDEITGVAAKFSKVYFNGIITEYLQKHPALINSKMYIETLQKAITLEDVICKQKGIKYINEILRNIPVDVKKKKVKYFNYPDFFETNKNRLRIYLANKNFVSQHYKEMEYDTVIIDDAHMLLTGEFNNIFRNKQVVVCGDYQSNMIVNQSLLSMASIENLVTLRNRYVMGPRKLTMNMTSFAAPHQKNVEENLGVKVIEKGIEEYLYNLYIQDNHVKVNFFIKDINRMREAYESISRTFYKKNVSTDEIINFLNNNMCICDANVRNYLASDVNIIYLRDYCNEDSRIIANNLFEILMLAKNELVIYDAEGLLLKNIDTTFYRMIKKTVLGENIFQEGHISEITKMIENELVNYGYGVYYSGNGVNMLIKKPHSDELISLFILYSNDNSFEVLNAYRDFYNQYVKNGHKIITRTIVDLLQDNKKFVKDICVELEK